MCTLCIIKYKCITNSVRLETIKVLIHRFNCWGGWEGGGGGASQLDATYRIQKKIIENEHLLSMSFLKQWLFPLIFIGVSRRLGGSWVN